MNPLLRPPIWPVIRHVLAPRARRTVKYACARGACAHAVFPATSAASRRAFMNSAGWKQRAALWAIFEAVRAELKKRDLMTLPEMYYRLAAQVAERKHPLFDSCGSGFTRP